MIIYFFSKQYFMFDYEEIEKSSTQAHSDAFNEIEFIWNIVVLSSRIPFS